ncbi:MoaD/ThiS family protein [Oleidesulfovibrio sp.]|uniref:MoaD/ThiS family protein n=1 Tax=Oleidesulfovibrio sp. TaxID=2909707 RepID=UPI003A8B7DDE
MNIEVKCFATLSCHSPQGNTLEMPEGTTVAQVMTRLGIAEEDVKIIFINGLHVDTDALLNTGDRLGLFPAVGGG